MYSHKTCRSPNDCRINAARNKGFTLIEIIIGIVVLSISMSIITSLILPAEKRSVDQIHQIKAAELGQGLLDEILGRSFDQNSDHAGGVWRCGEIEQPLSPCTDESNFGPDANEVDIDNKGIRSLFNDVDDYHEFSSLTTSTNEELDQGYGAFIVNVDVSYSGLDLGLANSSAKKVVVTITTPSGAIIEFAGYKSNF